MNSKHAPIIAVIGARDADEALQATSREVGALIASSGCLLATGGMGGVMEAASRGASEAGGTTIGILPGEMTSEANPYVSIPVATGFGIGRNIILVRTADALIAVGGAYGTLSEIALALQHKKPVIGIGTWDIEGVEQAQSPDEAVRLALRWLGR